MNRAAFVAGAAAFATFTLIESRRPLRRRRAPRPRRIARNLALAGVTAAVLTAIQEPILRPFAERVERDRAGLLQQFAMPDLARIAAGVLLLDYTLWWWHWANHRIPFFWRFHLVHHTDRDMDTSTALRFHFGEMTLATFFRAAQVRLLGTDRRTVAIWNAMLIPSILFQHSNTRLPCRVDRALANVIVTPRMHGIHHSVREEERNTNWSSLFPWWDWMHGTLLLDVPQSAVGVSGFGGGSLRTMLTLPFDAVFGLGASGFGTATEDRRPKPEHRTRG